MVDVSLGKSICWMVGTTLCVCTFCGDCGYDCAGLYIGQMIGLGIYVYI